MPSILAPWHTPAVERTPRRCAACGTSYHVEVGQTPAETDERHGNSGACDADERKAAFYGTAYGQGVRDGMEDADEYG